MTAPEIFDKAALPPTVPLVPPASHRVAPMPLHVRFSVRRLYSILFYSIVGKRNSIRVHVAYHMSLSDHNM